ncbi:MAG: prepilin-type N-terminal cleavage/methylation domain-containing protein [Planctomycetes bacterium]|nr:prepilin-type N-terminal cleavage/methylation domain-containing protein [Planctomycetota bacterium]MBL7146904.1 prepilin-type N-terminal cleavage/methylation domain-containing protein [Phycisphaerae bacterium]
MQKIDSKTPGFTLVEVMVAVTIGGFIMLVAVGTLKAITSSAEMVNTNISAAAEVRFAMNLISRDLVNFYRDENNENTKLIGITQESADGNASYLVFYTLNRMKARADQPEGDIYEVEYSLLQDGEKSLLTRRLWPNPNNEYDDEPHGILAVIAEDIDIFEVRYFDGEEWSNEWPEEMEVLPQLIEVSIVGKEQSRGNPAMESILVNLTRSVTATVAASESEEQGGGGGGAPTGGGGGAPAGGGGGAPTGGNR